MQENYNHAFEANISTKLYGHDIACNDIACVMTSLVTTSLLTTSLVTIVRSSHKHKRKRNDLKLKSNRLMWSTKNGRTPKHMLYSVSKVRPQVSNQPIRRFKSSFCSISLYDIRSYTIRNCSKQIEVFFELNRRFAKERKSKFPFGSFTTRYRALLCVIADRRRYLTVVKADRAHESIPLAR